MNFPDFLPPPPPQYPKEDDLHFCWCRQPKTALSLFHAVSFGRHRCLACRRNVIACGEFCDLGCNELQTSTGLTLDQLIYIKMKKIVSSIVL